MASARRRDIQRRNAVSVELYPADRGRFHGHPHVMLPNRPRNAICCHLRSPCFGLFDRYRWHGQRANGTPPDTCERLLVSGFGTPNVHQVTSTLCGSFFRPGGRKNDPQEESTTLP
jgi:hypothetical protein